MFTLVKRRSSCTKQAAHIGPPRFDQANPRGTAAQGSRRDAAYCTGLEPPHRNAAWVGPRLPLVRRQGGNGPKPSASRVNAKQRVVVRVDVLHETRPGMRANGSRMQAVSSGPLVWR